MKILSIESSCDDTAVSIIEAKNNKFNILANIISSQIDIHKKYGGVVPEVAARAHVENIIPLLDQGFSKAKTKLDQIDYIAVTSGPGLISSLLVGTETAKALSFTKNIPMLPINHLEGHIYANYFKNAAKIKFPYICLIVSGGHTELVLVKDHGQYKLIGQTRDDAVGEAFDKSAKLLGLPYPGGPQISKLAEQGDENAINFPKPMINSKNFDMSFSGLKTAVLYELQSRKKITKKQKADIAASFQKAVVDVLLVKSQKAITKYKVKDFLISGGVSANSELRKTFVHKLSQQNINIYIPEINLCTDNSLMIAIAGYYKLKYFKPVKYYQVNADPNWEIV